MIIPLDNLDFETVEGTWRTHYIGEPSQRDDNVDYHIRFKWVDPHDTENKTTPERRLRLRIYDSETIRPNYTKKLLSALKGWLDSDGFDAVFTFDSRFLRQHDRS